MTLHVSIRQVDPRSHAAMSLMRDMMKEESLRYSELGEHSDSFSPAEVLEANSAFVIAYINEQPVGCGALRRMDSERAEIKRMYVVPAVRRQGMGRAILRELERRALQFQYRAVRLETGNRQPEAIALYESEGFCRIPAFGEYLGDPVSVCFEKQLVVVPFAEQ